MASAMQAMPATTTKGRDPMTETVNEMAVWIDGEEARIFHVGAGGFDEAKVSAPKHHVHRHPKDEETRIRNHPDDEHRFFHAVGQTLEGATAILIMGPSITKLHFLRYLQKNVPAIEALVVGLETVNHPTDRQLVAHVKTYFHAPPRRIEQLSKR
jgi:stalled ribosome rescue protein Dom34